MPAALAAKPGPAKRKDVPFEVHAVAVPRSEEAGLGVGFAGPVLGEPPAEAAGVRGDGRQGVRLRGSKKEEGRRGDDGFGQVLTTLGVYSSVSTSTSAYRMARLPKMKPQHSRAAETGASESATQRPIGPNKTIFAGKNEGKWVLHPLGRVVPG
jgi:hypothetical protein